MWTEMKSRIFPLLLLLMLLTGCGGGYYLSSPSGGGSVDVEELLTFQSAFASKSPADRGEECRALLKRQQQSPQTGWVLRLMIGRLLSDSCGDPGRLVRSYDSLKSRSYLDRGVVAMGDYHSKVLQRLSYLGRKDASADKEPKGQSASGKDESKLLREKLEAIRTIEKEMDESKADESQR
jgi:hypothetical protein